MAPSTLRHNAFVTGWEHAACGRLPPIEWVKGADGRDQFKADFDAGYRLGSDHRVRAFAQGRSRAQPPATTSKSDTPLTKAQIRELKQLATAPQPTYGSGRARVQNNLVDAGLAQYRNSVTDEIVPASEFGLPTVHDLCEITAAGRECLVRELKSRK